MDALIKSKTNVLCPYCNNDKFLVIRRELKEQQNILVKMCRCEACGDTFRYAEDKEGNPISAADR